MKKVVYSITKLGKEETKTSGIGFISENQLLVAQVSTKTNKPYIRSFDIENKLTPILDEKGNTTNQMKGFIYEMYINSNNDVCQSEYKIWTMELEEEKKGV